MTYVPLLSAYCTWPAIGIAHLHMRMSMKWLTNIPSYTSLGLVYITAQRTRLRIILFGSFKLLLIQQFAYMWGNNWTNDNDKLSARMVKS